MIIKSGKIDKRETVLTIGKMNIYKRRREKINKFIKKNNWQKIIKIRRPES